MVYHVCVKIKYTDTFAEWLDELKDPIAKRAIHARIARLRLGLFGDVARYGKVSEVRIDVGPGYRVYFTMRGNTMVILLLGGDKRSQKKDFKLASQLAEQTFDFEA